MRNIEPHAKPKWPPEGQKMAVGVWKGVHSKVIGLSDQLSLNKFFDPSTPSIRKGARRRKTKMRNVSNINSSCIE